MSEWSPADGTLLEETNETLKERYEKTKTRRQAFLPCSD
jgi:hypothetical protein